jgi:hypothetical protein
MDLAHQDEFATQYRQKAKSVGKAYLFWMFGCHYLYFGNWSKQWLYWFTAAGVGIWMIIDAFRMPSMCHEYSRDTAVEVCRNIGMVK